MVFWLALGSVTALVVVPVTLAGWGVAVIAVLVGLGVVATMAWAMQLPADAAAPGSRQRRPGSQA